MASIEKRKRADGTTAYKVEDIVRVDGKRHKKTATFERLTTENAWAKKMEQQIKSDGPTAFTQKLELSPTVADADAVTKYIESNKVSLKSTKKTGDQVCRRWQVRVFRNQT
ncbi:hypothetical protein [Sulfitobacter sp.]|uniref:hypothetical protein n=1 Tax=Sulfitobacter sp. TaxID=1903071 RepID=UPI003002CFD2